MRFSSFIALCKGCTLPFADDPSHAAHSLPDPNIDPFYTVPTNISSYKNGHVLQSRPVITLNEGASVQSYQVLYRTNDELGSATATVATIWVPAQPAWPPRLFSQQVAEDSIAIDCAPSWAYVNSTSEAHDYVHSGGPLLIRWALRQGYYVISPDHYGPMSAMVAGRMEGHATLDGLRSALSFLGLPVNATKIGLWGYSGGSHATAWAATLHDEYAPELQIAAASYGGLPADIAETFRLIDGTPLSMLSTVGLLGLAQAYPKLNQFFSEHFSANGSILAKKLRGPRFCTPAHHQELANITFESLFRPDVNISQSKELRSVLSHSSLLTNVSDVLVPVPKMPRFQWHGTADINVPVNQSTAYVEQQCAGGADIRFAVLPGRGHVPTYLIGMPASVDFIQRAFEGRLLPHKCGQNVTGIPNLDSREAADIMTEDGVSALKNLLQESSM